MSDIKHIEYCIKLGNKIVQNKLEQGEYDNIDSNYIYQNKQEKPTTQQTNYVPPKRNDDFINFRDRLKNWK